MAGTLFYRMHKKASLSIKKPSFPSEPSAMKAKAMKSERYIILCIITRDNWCVLDSYCKMQWETFVPVTNRYRSENRTLCAL